MRGDEHDARAELLRKGASGSYTNAGTKQDVNLARKTLFSSGKVVNGRLGSRPR